MSTAEKRLSRPADAFKVRLLSPTSDISGGGSQTCWGHCVRQLIKRTVRMGCVETPQ